MNLRQCLASLSAERCDSLVVAYLATDRSLAPAADDEPASKSEDGAAASRSRSDSGQSRSSESDSEEEQEEEDGI